MDPFDPHRADSAKEKRLVAFLDLTSPRHRLLGLGSTVSRLSPSSSSPGLGHEMEGNKISSWTSLDAWRKESISKLQDGLASPSSDINLQLFWTTDLDRFKLILEIIARC
jgi:hypothetical protein